VTNPAAVQASENADSVDEELPSATKPEATHRTPVVGRSCRGYRAEAQPWKGERATISGVARPTSWRTIAGRNEIGSIRTTPGSDRVWVSTVSCTPSSRRPSEFGGRRASFARGSEESRRPRRVGGSPEGARRLRELRCGGVGSSRRHREPIATRKERRRNHSSRDFLRRHRSSTRLGEGDSPRPTWFTPALLRPEVQTAKANVPQAIRHFIAGCQPCFHLDWDWSRMALGTRAEPGAWRPADYFFDNKSRGRSSRTVTNLGCDGGGRAPCGSP